jgi:myo-inositol-1(or 4)-monophosphatase
MQISRRRNDRVTTAGDHAADGAHDGVSRWHPFNDEPRAAVAARLAVLGGQMALDSLERRARTGRERDPNRASADLAIQSRLVDDIRRRFPDDGVLGDDGPVTVPSDTDDAHWWVLGPIDSTTNLGHVLPGFAVSVGVLHAGMPLAGAVYDPLTDWLFTAASGRGAWLNGRGLRVNPAPVGTDTFFSIRTPYQGEVSPFVERWLRRYRLRRFGSTALQLCYVAAGGLAFVHDQGASLSEIAGAVPVVLEAGAVITGCDGSALFPIEARDYGGEVMAVLAGNPIAHRESLGDILARTDVPLSRS